MGDKIDKLPIDNTSITTNSDLEMIGALFQNKEQIKKISFEFKDSIIGGILFIILSSHQFDKLIRSSCKNELYIMCVKLLTFLILFYILKNRF
jgi:hypothetical protein